MDNYYSPLSLINRLKETRKLLVLLANREKQKYNNCYAPGFIKKEHEKTYESIREEIVQIDRTLEERRNG